MTLKKRLLALCMAVVMVFSLCSISAFAAAPTDDKQPVVIGRYDAPLSECLEPGMAMQVGIANVRVNSYATYDKNDGVQVHVELYVVLIAKAGIYRYDRKCQTYHEWPIDK